MLPRWAFWLMLAAFLLGNGGCTHRAPRTPERHYVVLPDNLPLGTEVCVPLVLRSGANQYACMPIDTLRWMLRHSTKG